MSVVKESDFHPDFFKEVPKSRGVPSFILAITVLGIICIFSIGGSVVFLAGHGHVWPSQQSMRYNGPPPVPSRP